MKFHFVWRRPWQATQDLSGPQDHAHNSSL
jgi:hypothetical protein